MQTQGTELARPAELGLTSDKHTSSRADLCSLSATHQLLIQDYPDAVHYLEHCWKVSDTDKVTKSAAS